MLNRRVSLLRFLFSCILLSCAVFNFPLESVAGKAALFPIRDEQQVKPQPPQIGEAFPFDGADRILQTASLSPDSFLLAYQKDDYDIAFRAGVITERDGTETVEYGEETIPVKARDSEQSLKFFKLVALNNRQAVLFFNFFDRDSTIRFRLINIDGKKADTPAVPNYETPQLNYDNLSALSVVKLSNTSLAVAAVQNKSDYENKKEGGIAVIDFAGGEIKIHDQTRFIPRGNLGASQVNDPVIVPLTERSLIIGWQSGGYFDPQTGFDSESKGYVAYVDYYDDRFHFYDDRVKVFFKGDLQRLQAQALTDKKFLLLFEDSSVNAPGETKTVIMSGEVFKNDVALKTESAFYIDNTKSVNLNAPARDAFTVDYRKSAYGGEHFIRVGELQNSDFVMGEEVAFNSSWKNKYANVNYQFTRLSDYKFLIAYSGVKSGTLIGKLGRPPTPVITDSAPSLLKTIALTDNKFVSAYAEKANGNAGWTRVGAVRGDGQTSFGSPTDFSREPTFALNAAALDATRVLLMYRSAGKTRAVVGTVSGDEISFGAPVEIGDGEMLSDLHVVPRGANRAVLAYRTPTNYAVLRPVGINGNALNLGGEFIVDSAGAQNARFKQLAVAGAGENLIVVYNYQSKNSQGDYVDDYRFRAARVAGDKINFNSAPVSVQGFQEPDAAFLSENKFAVAFRAHLEKNVGKLIVGNINEQGAIDLGNAFVFSDAQTRPVALAKSGENALALIYGNGAGSITNPADKSFVRLIALSGTNVASAGAPLALFDEKSRLLSICRLTPTDFVLAFSREEQNSAEVRVAQANLSGNAFIIR